MSLEVIKQKIKVIIKSFVLTTNAIIIIVVNVVNFTLLIISVIKLIIIVTNSRLK